MNINMEELSVEFNDKVKFDYDLKKKKLVQYWWQNKNLF